MRLALAVALLAGLWVSASGGLLPFGPEAGDQAISFSSPASAVALTVPVPYYNQPQGQLFISPKGAVSFDRPLPDVLPETEPFSEHAAIAVFYADAVNGKVHYRTEPHESETSKQLAIIVSKAYGITFAPKVVIVVTWELLIGTDTDGSNTFQIVLLSDARQSFAFLKYATLDWVETNNRHGLAGFYFNDGRKQAMINAGTDEVRNLVTLTNSNDPGSFLFSIGGDQPIDPRAGIEDENESDYDYEANVKEYDDPAGAGAGAGANNNIDACPTNPYGDTCPASCHPLTDDRGCMLCTCPEPVKPDVPADDEPESSVEQELNNQVIGDPVDLLLNEPSDGDQEQEQPIDQDQDQNQEIDVPIEPEDPEAVRCGTCDPHAKCVHHSRGSCCECAGGKVGNGISCIPAETPQRISGTFQAAINGEALPQAEFYAYAQPKDGQQHTTLAKVPVDHGFALLLLHSIGDPIGWLFATRGSENAYNGFELTGGKFNRTASVHIGDKYASLIQQTFVDGKVDVFVSGTLPTLNAEAQVTFPNFEVTYRRERPGVLQAYTDRQLEIHREGEVEKLHLTVEQKIHYIECEYKDFDNSDVIKVRSSRLNAHFSPADGTVRFASQNTAVDPNDEPSQPPGEGGVCSTGAHLCTQPNMRCEPVESSYRCVCERGYQTEIDDTVPVRFRCIPQPGAVAPAPGPGATRPEDEQSFGPGHCTSHSECHRYGECVFGPTGSGTCKCRGWYVGDGVSHCGPPEQQPEPRPEAAQPAPAAPVAPTVPVDAAGKICRAHAECGENANCVYSNELNYYHCECLTPYIGDGYTCTASQVPETQETCEQRLNCNPHARCVFNPETSSPICQCVEGFEGNGAICTPLSQYVPPIVQPPPPVPGLTECRDQSDCHTNAHCVFVQSHNKTYCECLAGFEGDGVHRCKSNEQCNPAAPSCHAHAECVFGSAESAYVCKCIQGFVGDGQTCYAAGPAASTCDREPTLCHANAQCQFDVHTNRYECVCKPGSTGDGYRACVVDTGCYENRSLCDAHAQCVPSEFGRYVCNCNYGFHGNGLVCHPDSETPADTLFVSRGMSVIQRSSDPAQQGRQLIVVPHQTVVGIDYDCLGDRIYWSDISGHVIRTANVNGTDVVEYYGDVLKSPEGIAIDWSSKNLYYADSFLKEIGVVSLDGKYQKSLVNTSLTNPRAVTIDHVNKRLYYSDWHREHPKIGRVDLDGQNNEIFVDTDIHLPNGLAVVYSTQELCWVDAGSQRLNCIGLDGHRRRVVYAPLEFPFGLTVRHDQRFYWTDWNSHAIHSVSVTGQGYTTFAPSVGGGKVYGIVSVPGKCQGKESACTLSNGGCKHLCLPSRNNEAKCTCPDNVTGLKGC